MFGQLKIRILLLSTVLTAMGAVAFAQTATPAAAAPSGGNTAAAPSAGNAAAVPAKIGIVNIQDAIIGTNEGKRDFEALQKKFEPKQAELKTLSDEVDDLKKKYEAQKDKLNADSSATQMRSIESKQKVLQRNYEDAQNEFQQAEQEVVNRIGGKMLTVMEKFANTHGYTVILDVSNPQTPVLYASQGTNITKELVDAYNAESPVPPPAATSAPAKTSSGPAAQRPTTPAAPTPKKP